MPPDAGLGQDPAGSSLPGGSHPRLVKHPWRNEHSSAFPVDRHRSSRSRATVYSRSHFAQDSCVPSSAGTERGSIR